MERMNRRNVRRGHLITRINCQNKTVFWNGDTVDKRECLRYMTGRAPRVEEIFPFTYDYRIVVERPQRNRYDG